MKNSNPVALVTGFEPFGQSPVNPSEKLLERLVSPTGWSLKTALLPVNTEKLRSALEAVLSEQEPKIILCLGEARGESRMRVELWAQNHLNFGQPDNAGKTIRNCRIEETGANYLLSGLCPDKALQVLTSLGIKTLVSEDAGAYLCNQLFYTLSYRYLKSETSVGFLHLPSLPVQNFGSGMPLERQLQGVQALIDEYARALV